MDSLWALFRRHPRRPSHEEVQAVLAREVAEAKRQEVERAIERHRHEIESLVDGVLPNRNHPR
ncbi:hypothetical protein [Oceaniglobus trochenteri]|uniref:hypothetical protein n=1 Tax=Oceaniglobus trochenteri TaxID=2763260 RepID=UPI001CFF6E5E|nr:hypothetical protein [Oceaniglobus trochenteri]